MCDVMIFPDTAEQFMEQYKIVDKEQVYTNGAELIPIFRMKQWLEHLQDKLEWCTDCAEYDHERHCCPRWNRVIRETLKDVQPEIIRCKDCKHWDRTWETIEGYHYCPYVDGQRESEYYCADAERRH